MNDVIDICKVQGEIVINDFNINDKGCDVVRLREKIGMVFQKPNPFPKTLYEIFLMVLQSMGWLNQNKKWMK